MDPKSFPKDPHFSEPEKDLSAGLDLSQYIQFKGHPSPGQRPAVSSQPAPKTLSEVELIEARAALHASATGKPVKLPEGIHHQLARAITG